MTPLFKRSLVAAFATCLFTGVVPAQTMVRPALPTTIVPVSPTVKLGSFTSGPSVEGIQQFTLQANGLRVLLFPDDSNPKITVNITYLVGSRHEGYGETGMAHLLEHMLFKSTPKFPKLWQDMANRGFINNGTTWFDRTNYYESFAASKENLKWALEMEADRMVNSNLLREELDTEMTVVRNEFEMGENRPQGILYEKVFASAFAWHNYGNSNIGNRSDIENVGIENLRAFYRTYYQPDNAVLLVAGKFDPVTTLAAIAEHFGKIPKPTRTLPKLWTVEPTQDGEREVTVRRVGDSQYLFSAYRVPPAAHPDAAALQVLAGLLTTEPAGRLYQALVKNKLAVSVDSESDVMFDPSLMGFWATLNKTQSIDKAREVMLATIESIGKKGFTEAELTRVKLQMAKSYDQTIADSGRFAVALSEAIAVGDWRFFFFHRDRLAKVTLADIDRVARAYFKPQNRTLGRFIPVDKPDRADMPVKPELSALLADYKGDPGMQAGEVFEPSAENLEKRIERFTLANGMKVALLPKTTRGNTAQLAMRIGYGDARTRAGKNAVDELTSALMMRGARGLDRQQIRDRLDTLRASGGMGLGGGSFQTKKQYLAELIDFIGLVYSTPTFPASELELVRKEMMTALEESAKDPESVASNAIDRHFSTYPKGDVRYVPTVAEQVADIRAVTREQIVRFSNDMRGLSRAEIAIVGDFDGPAIRAALTKAFANSKLGKPYQRVSREYALIKPKSEKLNTPDKENATFIARVSFPLQDSAADYPALALADFIVGGSAGARLLQRVREKEGLSYDVFSSLNVPTFSNRATWSFGFIANPQNAARAEASLRDELKILLGGQLTEEEFNAQRKSMLDQRQLRRSQDATLAAQLVTLLDADRTFAFTGTLEERIGKLTKADFDNALRKYIKIDEMSSFLAGDFSKVK
jgi:zinc protease